MRLTLNTMPAERMRGCVFSETFESTEAVETNGCTIDGSPVIDFGATLDGTDDGFEYVPPVIDYSSSWSFIAKINIDAIGAKREIFHLLGGTYIEYFVQADGKLQLYQTSSGTSNTALTPGVEHTVGVSYDGTTVTYYLDGVADGTTTRSFVNDMRTNMYLAQYNGVSQRFNGKVGYCKFFNQALTAQEFLDYHNGDVFNYKSLADVLLPMSMAEHDPVTGTTLDKSGNENDFYIGDGVGGYAPQKMSTCGYKTGGYKKYLTAKGSVGDYTNNFSVIMLIDVNDLPPIASGWKGICGRHDGTNGWYLSFTTHNPRRLAFAQNSSAKYLYEEPKYGMYTIGVSVGAVGDPILWYIDGVELEGTSLDANLNTSTSNLRLLISGSGATTYSFDGSMIGFMAWGNKLTPTQMFDAHLDLMKRVNKT